MNTVRLYSQSYTINVVLLLSMNTVNIGVTKHTGEKSHGHKKSVVGANQRPQMWRPSRNDGIVTIIQCHIPLPALPAVPTEAGMQQAGNCVVRGAPQITPSPQSRLINPLEQKPQRCGPMSPFCTVHLALATIYAVLWKPARSTFSSQLLAHWHYCQLTVLLIMSLKSSS